MTERKPSGFNTTLGVVLEVFPAHELSIRRLMKTNETFRDMCVDFSEARAALRMAAKAKDQMLEDQRREWAEIVERLQADMMNALLSYEASLPNVKR